MKEYKLVVNQDADNKITWLPRYNVPGELDSLPQPSTLPGAVIECGKWDSEEEAACKSDVFPCLFNVKEGKVNFIAFIGYKLIMLCLTD